MDSNSFTITAETVISHPETGEPFVSAVRLTGVSFAHPETIRDIAQEAIDSTYGSTNHRRVAIFTHEDWQNMRRSEPSSIQVPVHTY